jgi:hypothetical protein
MMNLISRVKKYLVRSVALSLIGLCSVAAFAQDIPSDATRQENKGTYIPLPSFHTLEFVRDKAENLPLMTQYLQPHTIQFIQSQHLTWLQVEEVYVNKKGVSIKDNVVLIPVIASVRYMKKLNVIDGTLNGLFQVSLSPNGEMKTELLGFDDNDVFYGMSHQRVGRAFWTGVNIKQFINDVAGDTLRVFFNSPEGEHDLEVAGHP